MRKFVISALVVLSLCGGIGVVSAPVWAESEKELNDEVNDLGARITKDKSDWRLFGQRGHDLIYLQRYDEAAADLKKAVSLNGDWVEGYGLVGSALIGMKEYNEAISYFDKALATRKHPHPDSILALKSLSLHKLGRDKDSIEASKASLKINPNNFDACYWEAASLNRLKIDKPEVLRLLHRCNVIDPSDKKVSNLIKAVESGQ